MKVRSRFATIVKSNTKFPALSLEHHFETVPFRITKWKYRKKLKKFYEDKLCGLLHHIQTRVEADVHQILIFKLFTQQNDLFFRFLNALFVYKKASRLKCQMKADALVEQKLITLRTVHRQWNVHCH